MYAADWTLRVPRPDPSGTDYFYFSYSRSIFSPFFFLLSNETPDSLFLTLLLLFSPLQLDSTSPLSPPHPPLLTLNAQRSRRLFRGSRAGLPSFVCTSATSGLRTSRFEYLCLTFDLSDHEPSPEEQGRHQCESHHCLSYAVPFPYPSSVWPSVGVNCQARPDGKPMTLLATLTAPVESHEQCKRKSCPGIRIASLFQGHVFANPPTCAL